MKFHSILSIAALCAITVFPSCKNDSDASKNATVETTGAQPAAGPTDMAAAPISNPETAAAPTPPPATTEPPQNAAGVWHYTCPKGCAGGAGAAESCAKCGTTLTHNTVYHGQPKTTATSANPAIAPGAATTPTKQPEPAQNAAGVWHYTCAAGCAGGAGAAGACAKCSKPLAHNQAYHQ